MSIEENKALVRRLVEQVHNKGNLAVVDELIGDVFVARGPLGTWNLTRAEMKQFVATRRAAIPDLRITIEELIAEGDKVVARGRDEGTPIAEYMGIQATGKGFNVSWIDIYRIANGRIMGMDYEMSMETMRTQMGA